MTITVSTTASALLVAVGRLRRSGAQNYNARSRNDTHAGFFHPYCCALALQYVPYARLDGFGKTKLKLSGSWVAFCVPEGFNAGDRAVRRLVVSLPGQG